MLFGIQQAAEAVIWSQTKMSISPEVITYATYLFLCFAYIIWPLWIPFACIYAETKEFVKKILYGTFAAGCITAIGLAYMLLTGTATTQLSCAHIVYNTAVPNSWYIPVSVLYLTSTVLPWLISSGSYCWIVGLALLIAYSVTFWMYSVAFTSVGCFFAALISSCIMLILDRYHEE